MSISPYRKHPSPNIHAPVFKQATKIDALMLLVLFIVQCTVLLTVLAVVLLLWSASIIMQCMELLGSLTVQNLSMAGQSRMHIGLTCLLCTAHHHSCTNVQCHHSSTNV